MYVFLCLVCLGVVTQIFNKNSGITTNEDTLSWTKRDLILLGSMIVASIILSIIPTSLYITFIAVVAFVVMSFIINKSREEVAKQYIGQVEQLCGALKPLLGTFEVDYNNLPFQTKKKDGKICQIDLLIQDTNKFNDSHLSQVTFSLNRILSYYSWKYECDFPSQLCSFKGEKHPPERAMWKGSDKRNPGYFPLGLTGAGEVGITFAKSDLGESSSVNEETGQPFPTVEIASAPQTLVLGSTGGGKSIWVGQELY